MANTTFMSKHEIGHELIWSAVVQCESLASRFYWVMLIIAGVIEKDDDGDDMCGNDMYSKDNG